MQKLRDRGRGSQVTLQQLEYFRVLAKFENINIAAKQIHISQPALSVSIKKLETELGYRLFDRTGNSIRINYRGEQFLEAVNDIFAVLESFKQRAYLPSEKHYELWLGMLSSSEDVINLCDAYMRKNDNVIIRFLSRRFLDGSPEMNRVDLFIGPQNLRTEGLSSTPLFSFRDYAIIPRAFVPSIPTEITHAKLKDMPFAMCCPPDIAQPKTLKGFLDEGYTPEPEIHRRFPRRRDERHENWQVLYRRSLPRCRLLSLHGPESCRRANQAKCRNGRGSKEGLRIMERRQAEPASKGLPRVPNH